MTVVPSLIAVTLPLLTVATLVLLLVQDTSLFNAVSGVTVAVKTTVLPACMVKES